MSILQLQAILAGLVLVLGTTILVLLRKARRVPNVDIPELPAIPKRGPFARMRSPRADEEPEVPAASPERLQRLKWVEPTASADDDRPADTMEDQSPPSPQFPSEQFARYAERLEKRIETVFAQVEGGEISTTEFEQRLRLEMADVKRDKEELDQWRTGRSGPMPDIDGAASSIDQAIATIEWCLDWVKNFHGE